MFLFVKNLCQKIIQYKGNKTLHSEKLISIFVFPKLFFVLNRRARKLEAVVMKNKLLSLFNIYTHVYIRYYNMI